jgi:hypothetical protein
LVASIVKVFALTVGTLIVLYTGIRLYAIDREADKGKYWCESVIREFELDRENFLEMHSGEPRRGGLMLRPSPEDKPARGRFIVESTGEFICTYHIGGFMFPHAYEYSSKTREWINVD